MPSSSAICTLASSTLFAQLGFDDHSWFCDADLTLVVAQGKAEVAHLKAERDQAVAEIQRLKTEGKDFKGQEKALANREDALKKRELALAPYGSEYASRQTKSSTPNAR